ncbi:adenosylcobinamide-GDP ribazoletransferase [Robertmurraya yapensis]|uniref:Adenosylcobinamide-GDP ribazoletransferase n=1 Tax=Bacillus yapensis TaxID=2492960 RepID=A0A431VYY1_9BACI|nr:adenosylcobinamide-GDP ribazoletransferase [Bacillus yapensis]RTR28470.1 adenosylcobinamide-GDP ribazoletransferase [Bacillus yapensis]TKS94531.1 adenosylcobinamide-GDP ribazoletransferase [Bacillus yapensis]
MTFLKGFLLNLQFFTSIPIRVALPMDKKHLQSSIKSFPLVGLLQGILYSGLVYVLIQWTPFSTVAIAFLLWLATIIITGGIHLDGWMDVSDAYFSYQDQEKRLEIMKDPRIGAFGVLAVIVLLSSRFLFIYEIIGSMSFASYFMVALIPFLGKSIMGAMLVTIPSAKKEGLAAMFQEAGKRRSLVVYPIYLAIVAFFVQWMGLIVPFFILVGVALVCYGFIRIKAIKWFNGITGDVLGASVEGTEMILWLTLWLLHYFVMG